LRSRRRLPKTVLTCQSIWPSPALRGHEFVPLRHMATLIDSIDPSTTGGPCPRVDLSAEGNPPLMRLCSLHRQQRQRRRRGQLFSAMSRGHGTEAFR
jgi:hypothetical protein